MVVLPAASRPTISIRICFLPNSRVSRLLIVRPIFPRAYARTLRETSKGNRETTSSPAVSLTHNEDRNDRKGHQIVSNCVTFMRFDDEFRQSDVCVCRSFASRPLSRRQQHLGKQQTSPCGHRRCVAGNSWQDLPHTPLHPGTCHNRNRTPMRLISAFYPDVRIPRLTLFLLFRSLVSDVSESRVIQRRLTKRGHLRRTANDEKFAAQRCQFYRARI